MIFNSNRIFQLILIISSLILVFYGYFYLPSKNKGSIKTETKEEVKIIQEIKNKSTFSNTEYLSTDREGRIYTTKSKESYILQSQPDLIYLTDVYSYGKLKKDNSLVEIKSKNAIVNKKENETIYKNQVTIVNKSYRINSNLAKHIAKKNLIIVDGNVIMKDLSQGLSHIIYADTLELDTVTNNAVVFMKSKDKKVLGKKFK